MDSSIVIMQGYLKKRAMKSGKNWKQRWFVLYQDGRLTFADKKGGGAKKTMKITHTTQIDPIREGDVEHGFSVIGIGHEPLYLQAEFAELAEGWIKALNIIKVGGDSRQFGEESGKKGTEFKQAFANRGAMGAKKNTLERKKKQSTLERKEEKQERPISFNPDDLPPPPPGSDDEAEDVADPARDSIVENENGTQFTDGYMMRIKDQDYFVDSLGWEYYSSRKAFLNGEKPLGKAILSLCV